MKDFLKAVGWNDFRALSSEQKAVGLLLLVATFAVALMANAVE